MLHWRRDRTAFAISGGGARGAAQVGMLRALIERDITPDFVVGVSIGAWNGAWLAHRPGHGLVASRPKHGPPEALALRR